MDSAPGDEAPTADGLVLRDERTDDESFLRSLYYSTRVDEFASAGLSPAQAEGLLRMQFDAQRAHYRLHYPDASYRIVLLDGRPVGRLYVHYTSLDVRVLDISLLPEIRGKGLGRRLLANVIDEAAGLGAPVTLHVARRSPARRLYERLGFRIVNEDAMNAFMERPN